MNISTEELMQLRTCLLVAAGIFAVGVVFGSAYEYQLMEQRTYHAENK